MPSARRKSRRVVSGSMASPPPARSRAPELSPPSQPGIPAEGIEDRVAVAALDVAVGDVLEADTAVEMKPVAQADGKPRSAAVRAVDAGAAGRKIVGRAEDAGEDVAVDRVTVPVQEVV